MSLRLQSAFGLRQEESIKIVPVWADGGDRLKLKDTWTKGGKYRESAIRAPEQRTVLNAAKRFAAGGSLIPLNLSYRDQLQRFRAECDKAGIHGGHGLRHNYAQERYHQLTGWQSPSRGGPRSSQLGRSKGSVISRRACCYRKKWAMAESRLLRCTWAARAGSQVFSSA
jgi:hypothetical protein